jgi:AcrR family transcriptional regulator
MAASAVVARATPAPPAAVAPAATKRGRPRNERVEQAVLAATVDLVAEHGYAGLTVEAVAARSGVAKSTVYRRWPGKDELLIDALNTVKGPLAQLPGGTVEYELKWLMEHMRRAWLTGNHGMIMRRLAAEGSDQPELYRRFRERVVEPRRAITRSVLQRGIAEGSIRPDIDVDAVIGMLAAPVIVGVMMHGEKTLTRKHVEYVVSTVLAGIAT